MKIRPGIEIINLALHLKIIDILIIGDIHIGYEEGLRKSGIYLPRHHFKDINQDIKKIFDKLPKVKKILVNGDLKHEFGRISEQEWRDCLKFIDKLRNHCDELILIKGNHDPMLGPICAKRKITLVDSYYEDSIFITHGHKVPTSSEYKKAKTLIIGNEHTAITLSDGPRKETYKCFLSGKFDGKDMIVMPSFNPITIGTNVLDGKFISPFLKGNIAKFEVYVVQDKIYKFGKLSKIKRRIANVNN